MMGYKELTVFNYKVAYYMMRLFGLYWLFRQYQEVRRISQWPAEIYEPVLSVQRLVFPAYPDVFLYGGLSVLCAGLLICTIFKQSYILNVMIFILVAVLNFPVAMNFSIGHHNHLVIIGFFMSIFLLPKNLTSKEDYKWVQYFYLGLLSTYSLAGFSKFLGIAKNIITRSGKMTWLDKNAAQLNTLDSYRIADLPIPDWIIQLYAYENAWVLITILGIFTQAFCFLGAFNRRMLTVIMLFLYAFHLYTEYFILADFRDAKNFVAVALFPYHLLYPLWRRVSLLKTSDNSTLQ